jgi:hypothetical protein
MTAEEMVEKLRIAMGDEVEPYLVSTQTVFQWLSDAYLRIQIEYDQWKFFRTHGLILTTKVDIPEYAPYNVKDISKDSVYCVKNGESARFPMFFMEYEHWVQNERINLQQAGNPMFFIKLPDNTYRIDPIPTEVWKVYGDVWYKPAGFEELTDEPIWDEKYHNLVVWEALKVAALEWPDNKKAQRMQANLSVNLPPMRRAFNYEYLPSKGSASALL